MNEYEIDSGPWMNSGQEVTTDWLGRFSFTDVPPTEIFVRCSGYGSSAELALPPDEPCRDLRIELVRSGTFVFESSNPYGGPRTLHVLDEADERLSLEVWLGKGRSIRPRADRGAWRHLPRDRERARAVARAAPRRARAHATPPRDPPRRGGARPLVIRAP
jgi:hypothetical protein